MLTATIEEKRPWGKFEQFTLNEISTVKLVYLDGGKRLSLQYHNKRTEFWKVIKGPIKVQIGENGKEIRTLNTGESITIPQRVIHRLMSAGPSQEGIILEISTGEFDERDIIRLEDDYKRA